MENYLKYVPKPLLDDVVQGRCIPIIGAGFSQNAEMPTGLSMPSWEDLGKYFSELIHDYTYSTPIDAISAFSYEFSKVKLVEELAKVLHIQSANPGAAHDSFAKVPFTTVITTNFDFLLERTYESARRRHWVIMNEDQLSMNMSEPGTVILKIHGDLNHPSRLVATEEDYDTFLDTYPLLSTYISNLLISRTPLFIGYSLEDPDFRHLWRIIGNRLGKLRRPAYAIRVSPSQSDIARYERRGAKVIALPRSKANYGEVLSTLFEEIKNYWGTELIETSTIVDDETQFELILPRGSLSRLCFFAVPAKSLIFYRRYVFPVVERYGFTPFTAMDVLSPGENDLAKISNLIDRATIVVADVSSPWVMAELDIAIGKGSQILVIAEKDSRVPFDVRLATIERPTSWETPSNEFTDALAEYFRKSSKELEHRLHEEPARLLGKKEFRAAVSAAMTLLEIELRETKGSLSDEQNGPRYFSFSKLLAMAKNQRLISEEEYAKVLEWWNIRNRVVHTREPVASEKAREIVNGIMGILNNIRK